MKGGATPPLPNPIPHWPRRKCLPTSSVASSPTRSFKTNARRLCAQFLICAVRSAVRGIPGARLWVLLRIPCARTDKPGRREKWSMVQAWGRSSYKHAGANLILRSKLYLLNREFGLVLRYYKNYRWDNILLYL